MYQLGGAAHVRDTLESQLEPRRHRESLTGNHLTLFPINKLAALLLLLFPNNCRVEYISVIYTNTHMYAFKVQTMAG